MYRWVVLCIDVVVLCLISMGGDVYLWLCRVTPPAADGRALWQVVSERTPVWTDGMSVWVPLAAFLRLVDTGEWVVEESYAMPAYGGAEGEPARSLARPGCAPV